ncbi:MAG: hypothetical protein JWR38_5387 [Mucilaginibacter sp.]|nr:hypothetical protein [Mucilaginibacter sp.]
MKKIVNAKDVKELCSSLFKRATTHEKVLIKKDVMLSSVEAWWAGLCALPFDRLRMTGLFFVSHGLCGSPLERGEGCVLKFA